MNRARTTALVIFLLLAPTVAAGVPRSPLGVYAVVNVNEYTTVYLKSHPGGDVETYLSTIVFPDLLDNRAVSGIVLYETWAQLNPNAPSSPKPYDWSLIDDLFTAVANWDSANPSFPPKTVQLVILPGFNSPPWLLDEIPSCVPLFYGVYVASCGTITFTGFKEGGVVDGKPVTQTLPLPWNSTYKTAWQNFLTVLAGKYGSKSALVSISVAGPTASSEEMILPTSRTLDPSATQVSGLTAEEIWDDLLAIQYTDPSYQQSDKAFIEEWKNAIDMYGSIFSNITLIATTGDGLPNLTDCEITTSTTCTFTLPPDPVTPFAMVCPVANMDCAAETTILAYFDRKAVGGSNAKATQTDGMKGSGSTAFNLGVPGVKLISDTTQLFTSPSARILGGSQFATAFSTFPVQEGCTSLFPPHPYSNVDKVPVAKIPSACLNPANTETLAMLGFKTFDQKTEAPYLISPEQSEFNVLNWFFQDTPEGAYFSGTSGLAPLNYVQIYGPDITYATKHSTDEVPVVMGGTTISISAQNLLFLASSSLGIIAEKP